MKTLKIGDLLARLPIIQGGMGVGISLSGLASAVANQGGVGVISSAGLGVIYREHSKDYNTASIWGLREELRKAREKTKGIIGVNVMVAMSNFADMVRTAMSAKLDMANFADMVRTAIAEKADIIFSGAGMPLNLPSFLTKGSKTKLAPIVSSARAAKLICEKWLANYKYVPDAIVVEGPKAGGHLGYKPEQITDEHFSLERLLPEIVSEVRRFGTAHDTHIPVIAAGGIGDGRGIAAAFMLGAEAVQMGTRFVVAKESIVHENYKQRIIKAKDIDSAVTGRTHGHPVRCLRNQMTREYNRLEAEGKSFEELEYLTLGTLRKAVQEGDTTNGTVMAGQIAGLVSKEETVEEILKDLYYGAAKKIQEEASRWAGVVRND